MSLAQRMHFLQDVIQMTVIALVSVINHYHINGLHLFWDTLHIACIKYLKKDYDLKSKKDIQLKKNLYNSLCFK